MLRSEIVSLCGTGYVKRIVCTVRGKQFWLHNKVSLNSSYNLCKASLVACFFREEGGRVETHSHVDYRDRRIVCTMVSRSPGCNALPNNQPSIFRGRSRWIFPRFRTFFASCSRLFRSRSRWIIRTRISNETVERSPTFNKTKVE